MEEMISRPLGGENLASHECRAGNALPYQL
jgi:hypothetical protein